MPDTNKVITEDMQIPVVEQKESLKLTKLSKGNYNWEIKILSLDIERLEQINNQMKLKFGDFKELKDEKHKN